MSIKFKPDSTLSAEPFPSAPAEKDIITLLGVQGLSHNDYSIVELKVMLQLIKHAQKVIVNYVIPQRVSHNGFYFTSEQLAAGHTIVEMKLSELDITGGKHCAQLRQVITQMPRKPIELPFKVAIRRVIASSTACLRARYIRTVRADGWRSSSSATISSDSSTASARVPARLI